MSAVVLHLSSGFCHANKTATVYYVYSLMIMVQQPELQFLWLCDPVEGVRKEGDRSIIISYHVHNRPGLSYHCDGHD